MQIQSLHFRQRAARAVADPALQASLESLPFAERRAAVVAEFGLAEFEAVRDAGAEVRDRVLDNLAAWIERFEAEAARRGAVVLFARDGEEAAALVLDIARHHGSTRAIKSKSMLSEEADLNRALAAAGVEPVETDLGEYICQLADEPPSHIIAPAMHKTLAQISRLFAERHGAPALHEPERMTREARGVLRGHFLSADLGISGGNFLVAETGSLALVTNEGNGRMVTTLPPVHVAITGIEKVVPTLEDLSTLMRLLPRSATGQHISSYFSVVTGVADEGGDVRDPRDPRDNLRDGRAGLQRAEGPRHMYFVLVDNGRSKLVGGDMQEMLRCIRCGACMNHCPVYQTVGGHAYGWVYPGPMGAVLTPVFQGLENAPDLPQAATLCGACNVVCPVKIPLPELLRKLREKQVGRGLRPWHEMAALRLWSAAALHPRLYGLLARWGARTLRMIGGRNGMIRRLPLASGWTTRRFMPAPRGRTFRDLYAARAKRREREA
jgi:L-lactate dehydrogenase complex protein LldF